MKEKQTNHTTLSRRIFILFIFIALSIRGSFLANFFERKAIIAFSIREKKFAYQENFLIGVRTCTSVPIQIFCSAAELKYMKLNYEALMSNRMPYI